MSEKITCYLCGSQAFQYGTDVGLSRTVNCSNDKCVEYKIKMEAIPTLESPRCPEKTKQHLQKKAKNNLDQYQTPLLITKDEVLSPS